jgi:hypothetical protein
VRLRGSEDYACGRDVCIGTCSLATLAVERDGVPMDWNRDRGEVKGSWSMGAALGCSS